MPFGVDEIYITQVRGYWEVYVNGKFFCTADSYIEAVKEVQKAYD